MVKGISIFLLIFLSLNSFGQETNRIQKKNIELQNIKSEIEALQKEIEAKSKVEKESMSVLDKINGQRLYLNKLLNRLSLEIKNLETEITNTDEEIRRKEERIKQIRANYEKYVVWFYKNGIKTSNLKYFVDSESLNQALMRYRYLSYLNQSNADVIGLIEEEKLELKNLYSELGDAKKQKNELASSKKKEQNLLDKRKKESERLISKLKKDKGNISREIDQKRQAEERITLLIAKLIESEKKSLEGHAGSSSTYSYDYSYDKFEKFMNLKGRLNWPVNDGTVIRKFGENKNIRLKTVTINYGVDILTRDDTKVHSVAEGIVSAIDWIPGYGSVIIITHRDNFRTVYGHVSEILVNEGDTVKGGAPLGIVDKTLEGNVLHFEIWRERDHQNPEIWLVSR